MNPLPRWRCEFRNSDDRNLVAKFFRAANSQEAMDMAMRWHGGFVTITVTRDKE